MAEAAPASHLETIDYKPPASNSTPVVSTMPLEEKKSDHAESEGEQQPDSNDNNNNNENDDTQFDLYAEEAEWDEGGKSHCGYGEAFHSTLMGVGETVHNLVGEPSPRVEKELKAVGNWFQEAAYATRDLFGGSNGEGDEEGSSGMGEDAMDAVKTLLRGGSKEGKAMEQGGNGEQDENKDPSGTDAPEAAQTLESTN